MTHLAPVGGALGCLGLAFLFAARGRGVRLLGLGLTLLGAALLAAYLVPSGHGAYLTGVGIVAALVCGGLGLLLRRWPWALAFATLALIPVRVPVHVGHSGSKLLLPLYVVAGAAAVQIFVETLQGDERSHELGFFGIPLAAFVLWTGISLTWSGDVNTGAIELLAFYLPFGVIALGLARLPWSRRALVWLAVELCAMALAFAVVGIYQYQTRNVFWNPKVIVANAYAPFYRVNSVFWDPSIYGRFLMIAIVAALVVVVLARWSRQLLGVSAAIVLIWLGLLLSFSQSSFAALVVAIIGLAAIAWRARALLAVGLVFVVLAGAGISSPHVRSALIHHTKNGLNKSTSGRAGLVSNGIKIAVHNPVFGVGVGDFKKAYAARTHLKGKEPKKAASHNTPVTVAAESGFVGLALLLWFVFAAGGTMLRRLGRSFEHRAAIALGLAFVAIVVHSQFYADFFEDPMTWGLIGLGALAAGTLARRREEARA
jgi:O-antigen ligase